MNCSCSHPFFRSVCTCIYTYTCLSFIFCIFIYVYTCLLCIFIFMYIYICLPCIHQKNDEDMASWGMAQRKMVQETQKHTVPSVILVGVQQHLSAIIIPLGTIAIPQSNSWTLKIANVEWRVGKQPAPKPHKWQGRQVGAWKNQLTKLIWRFPEMGVPLNHPFDFRSFGL